MFPPTRRPFPAGEAKQVASIVLPPTLNAPLAAKHEMLGSRIISSVRKVFPRGWYRRRQHQKGDGFRPRVAHRSTPRLLWLSTVHKGPNYTFSSPRLRSS